MDLEDREFRIAVLVGGQRAASQDLTEMLARLAPRHSFRPVDLGPTPHNAENRTEWGSETVSRLAAEIEAADALLFVTPDHNRSILSWIDSVQVQRRSPRK